MSEPKKAKGPSAAVRRQLAAKDAWNAARPAGNADFFTFGYSGRKIDEIVAALQEHGVRTVLDIRQNAVSVHRLDMSKVNLAKTLEKNGIGYVHAPELGIPRAVRAKAGEREDRGALWDWYDKHALESEKDLIKFWKTLQQPVAAMCMELDPSDCHRHRLALALEKKGMRSFDL